MRNCTTPKQAARHFGIPDYSNRVWWWRAQHVINCPERVKMQAFNDWARRYYAAEVAALCRRASMHSV